MVGTITSLIVTVFAARYILKRYQPQIVLLTAGVALMLVAVVLGVGPDTILPAKVKSTGWIGFDMFKFVERTMSARVAGLGLMIMSAGAFATYLDRVGASRVMVLALITPLRALKAPYILLSVVFVIGAALKMFIASAAGLSMLLMVTTFPLLTALGVSREAAAAMVVTCGCFDLGPASGSAVLAANNSGIPIALYFVKYQIPVAIPGYLTMAVSHYFVQRHFDKKDGVGIAGGVMSETATVEDSSQGKKAPNYYGFLPLLPLTFLLVFNNEIGIKGFNLDLVTVMLLCFAITIFCECLRTRDVKAVFKDCMVFFETMGKMFVSVITLIVAGETFAQGLIATGSIGMLIQGSQSAGFGPAAMTLVMTVLIIGCSIVMGSANAPFFAFAALAPKIAVAMKFHPVIMLLPMHLIAGMSRPLSPIVAIVVAVAGVANISPLELVRRNVIPVSLSIVVVFISCMIYTATIH